MKKLLLIILTGFFFQSCSTSITEVVEPEVIKTLSETVKGDYAVNKFILNGTSIDLPIQSGQEKLEIDIKVINISESMIEMELINKSTVKEVTTTSVDKFKDVSLVKNDAGEIELMIAKVKQGYYSADELTFDLVVNGLKSSLKAKRK